MSLLYHLLDNLAPIVLLISSCNVSQFASVPEGKVRLHDDDEDFIGDSFDVFHGDEEGIS